MKQKYELFDMMAFAKKRKVDATVLFLSMLLGVVLDWTMVEIAVFLVFIWSLLGPIPSRFLALPALFFLSFTPVLLLFGRETRAEEFAVFAYYFLVMAVIRGIIEVRKESQGAVAKN